MSLKGKLSALRFGRGGRQHVYTSAGVILAAVAVVSVLTWLNDAHKPIVRSIEEAVESSLPEALEQVDEQVATLLGVDEETVRTAREGLAGLVTSQPERLIEIATGQPVSTSSTAPVFAALPTPGAAAPASEEPSSPTATDAPPPPQRKTPRAPPRKSRPPPPKNHRRPSRKSLPRRANRLYQRESLLRLPKESSLPRRRPRRYQQKARANATAGSQYLL